MTSHPDRPAVLAAPWVVPVAIATILTAVNVVKPVYIDDVTYLLFARHISEHPLDPYQFSTLYWDRPMAANRILVPPLVPYWLAGAVRVTDSVAAWKLAMLPFDLLFAGGLYALLRRFAPGWAELLTVMVGLSPTALPATNLMLDVPAAGLSLTAVALLASACDRPRGVGRAALAGAVAGLAIQAKYTGLLTPVLLIGYGWAFGRPRYGLIAAGVAGAVAAAWEAFLIVRQGESHFYFHAFVGPARGTGAVDHAWALPSILGQTAPLLGAVLAVGLRAPAWVSALLLTLLGASAAALAADSPWRVELWQAVGVGTVAALAAGGWVAARPPAAGPRAGLFLALWVAVEVAGYFGLSPFPATRRTIGLVTAGTLLAGHLLARGPVGRGGRLVVAVAVAGTVLAGVAFAAVDHLDASARKFVVEDAIARARRDDPAGTVWHNGYGGFQFYAERAGAKQVVPVALTGSGPGAGPQIRPWPDEGGVAFDPPTRLRPGDWVIAPAGWTPGLGARIPEAAVVLVGVSAVRTAVPLDTTGYYAGYYPVERFTGPRAQALLLRVTQPCWPYTVR